MFQLLKISLFKIVQQFMVLNKINLHLVLFSHYLNMENK